MKHLLSVTALIAGLLCFDLEAAPTSLQDSAPTALKVGCDPRVELMSILMRIADAREYKMESATSPYSAAVDEWFSPFTEHAAVKSVLAMRQNFGVGYDAPMDLAVHLKSVESMDELIPFDLPPQRLGKRWELKATRDFLVHLSDFVEKSSFLAFVAEHDEFYTKCAKRMRSKLGERSYLPWLKSFFGDPPGARFQVIPGLLNGGANYGVGVVFPDKTEFISPVIGIHTWDAEGLPVLSGGFVSTVVHEFVHSYTNHLVIAHWSTLEPSADRLFAHCKGVMRLQAYATSETMMFESMVRASVRRYMLVNDTPEAAAAHLESEIECGFIWTEELAAQLERYEQEREQFPRLDAYMSEVASFFATYADKYEALMAKAPHVVSITPDPALLVDPSTTGLVITFDRPMLAGSYSIVRRGKSPEFGEGTYDSEGKVLRVPMKLEPDIEYSLYLNDKWRHGFQSADGLVLDPLPLRFTTRRE